MRDASIDNNNNNSSSSGNKSKICRRAQMTCLALQNIKSS